MAISSEGPAPYAPANNVLFAIEQYCDKGYDAITKELMLRLGFSDSYSSRTISALRLLDLIDEGVPTSSFKELRKATDDEYLQRLGEVLRNAYAEV